MKLYHINKIQALCDVVDRCEGELMVLSQNGERKDLREELDHYVELSEQLGVDESRIEELDISVEKPADAVRLIQYMMSA